jgi:hypothetical protein
LQLYDIRKGDASSSSSSKAALSSSMIWSNGQWAVILVDFSSDFQTALFFGDGISVVDITSPSPFLTSLYTLPIKTTEAQMAYGRLFDSTEGQIFDFS